MKSIEKLDRKLFGASILTPFIGEEMPEVKDPALAPDPTGLVGRRAKEKEIKRRKTSGRASTIMSESNKLG
jgi:hypothetical protein